jgi:hypothetical protein
MTIRDEIIDELLAGHRPSTLPADQINFGNPRLEFKRLIL